jgi:hypothetical protein
MGPAALAEQLWFRTEKPRHLEVTMRREDGTTLAESKDVMVVRPG